MCFSCKPTSHLCLVCGTDHAPIRDAAQPAVTPAISHRSLSAMPGEIIHRLIRFNPDSVLIFMIASRAFNQTGRAFLQQNTLRIVAQCQHSSLPLYRNIYRNFIRFSLSFPPNDARLPLSIPKTIRSFGISPEACPNSILSIGDIQQFDPGIQNIQDSNLQIIWVNAASFFAGIPAFNAFIAGIPAPNASAHEIRTWLRTNQPLLQGIPDLHLSNLRLTCVPTEIGLFNGLRQLFLGNNQLVLPAGLFCGLGLSLQTLNLSYNRLSSLPAGLFCGLGLSLQTLNLSGNNLRSVPAGLFCGLGPSLQTLDLSWNHLHSVPAGLFCGLGSSLHTIDLSKNRLHSLPEGLFCGLGSSLHTIDLSGNSLSYLPAGLFCGLGSSLQTLKLSSNSLCSLSADLFDGLGTSLQNLDLSLNHLCSFPAKLLCGFESLQELKLFGNPQLLIFYKDLPKGNNITVIHEFFNYTCKSRLAAFYQLAGGASYEAVKVAFGELDPSVKNAILRCVWVEENCPSNSQFVSMITFYGALKRYVKETLESLSDVEKNALYRQVYLLAKEEGIDIDAYSDLQWGEHHAWDNIPRLIDAMLRLKWVG